MQPVKRKRFSMNQRKKAALFDLDGVVFDTEPQYTIFWETECRRYFPEQEGLAHAIKGSTLGQIFEKYFTGSLEDERGALTERLNAFERNMEFPFVPGFVDFLSQLSSKGVLKAIVTSSNQAKMANVYHCHPHLKNLFDIILTAEDFARSKPFPDCYLTAAERLSVSKQECVVFEDSFNGIRSGRDAGMTVVGLATTNDIQALQPLCDYVISDYHDAKVQKIIDIFGTFQ